MGKKDKSSKRKIRDTDVPTGILSHDGLVDKDVNEVMDDLSEPTMGEKLASLKLEGKDNALIEDLKPPSADSIYILLKQALRSEDRALLIDCLHRQDEKVISNSLSVLNPSDVLVFLHALVPIIQLRGAVLACAIPWLRNLLLQHAGSIMSQESSINALNSIYQLIESRVSTFNHVLQLSTCLDLLYAETVDDDVEENDAATPFIYEDNDDESDDEGSDISMEVDGVEDGHEPLVYNDISD
ncbi:hypothetical protein ABFX02_03G095700 [Erythranthe guttata]